MAWNDALLELAEGFSVFLHDLPVQHRRVAHHVLRPHAVQALHRLADVHEMRAPIELPDHLVQHAVGQVAAQQREAAFALAQAPLGLLHPVERPVDSRVEHRLVEQGIRHDPQPVGEGTADGRVAAQRGHRQFTGQESGCGQRESAVSRLCPPVEPHGGNAQRGNQQQCQVLAQMGAHRKCKPLRRRPQRQAHQQRSERHRPRKPGLGRPRHRQPGRRKQQGDHLGDTRPTAEPQRDGRRARRKVPGRGIREHPVQEIAGRRDPETGHQHVGTGLPGRIQRVQGHRHHQQAQQHGHQLHEGLQPVVTDGPVA